jgi:fructosamine-3-kinase
MPDSLVDRSTATALVRAHVDPALTVTRIEPLHGGMVNQVVRWRTDGEPADIVAKLTPAPDHGGFRGEYESLDFYRRQTRFPVPEPYACVSGEAGFAGTALLMQMLPGRHLGDARLDPAGMEQVQSDLARHVADLHEHKRARYGPATDPDAGYDRWLDHFGPAIGREYEAVADRLQPDSRRVVRDLLDHLDDWLPETGDPTLVHGDLWATNILVDDRPGPMDRPAISGFVDGHARYSEVEFELAYLRVFHTADATFFERYPRRHPLREGFDRRCRVYWLNTLMLHVRVFGDAYLPGCEAIVRQIAALA